MDQSLDGRNILKDVKILEADIADFSARQKLLKEKLYELFVDFLPNTPSEDEQEEVRILHVRDEILEINGNPVTGHSIESVQQYLLASAGVVVLKIAPSLKGQKPAYQVHFQQAVNGASTQSGIVGFRVKWGEEVKARI
ncbi:55 kDa erythrocyte membrane protein [Echinococcus multilocularis]|uniref:55 kDa erythrocyte membrane protein n=1 Tax=Echinococcus multilocularis TaxID=6211 RepID=A0A068YEI2_ECHMU|nr:55 kDa erythrocyte membrane protein [Echinococcus multilocularis]